MSLHSIAASNENTELLGGGSTYAKAEQRSELASVGRSEGLSDDGEPKIAMRGTT